MNRTVNLKTTIILLMALLLISSGFGCGNDLVYHDPKKADHVVRCLHGSFRQLPTGERMEMMLYEQNEKI